MNAPAASRAATFQSAVTAYANPARLAVTARLLGFQPTPLVGAQVLQIGENVAANLVALAAANPETQFVGVELATGPVDDLPVANALQLDNLSIHARSPDRLTDPMPGGRFNYVLCAGSYGRLTPVQRSALLHQVAASLSPDGVICLGYPCLPGGYWHSALTSMLRQHVAQLPDLSQRAAQARTFLAFLVQATADDSAYGKLLRQTKGQADLMSDLHIELEYLAPPATPVALTELLQTAAPAGLTYLGDLDVAGMTDMGVAEKTRDALNEIKKDPARHEQYLDFVRGRAFRHTLLVNKAASVDRHVTPERIATLAVASPARPAAANINPADGVAEDFRHPRGAVLHAKNGITKAALARLAACWPQAVPFADLLAAAAADCALATDQDAARAMLATDLLGYFANGLIELHITPFPLTLDVGALPRAWPLARLQVQHSSASGSPAWVTNLRHENVPVDAFSREVLAILDGTHDRPALLAHLRGAVEDGRLEARSQGEPVTDATRLEALLVDGLDLALRRLASWGVLQ